VESWGRIESEWRITRISARLQTIGQGKPINRGFTRSF